MQNKLATWSSEDKESKFDRLLRIIADRTWLQEAARVTLSYRGARTPGIDGIDEPTLGLMLRAELERIGTELLAGMYQPLPAKRVYIPKATGSKDHWVYRPYGIGSCNGPC